MHRDDLSLTRRHNCLDNISRNFTLTLQLFHYTSLTELWSTELYMHFKHCTAHCTLHPMQYSSNEDTTERQRERHRHSTTKVSKIRLCSIRLQGYITAQLRNLYGVSVSPYVVPCGHVRTQTLFFLFLNRMAQTV
jgi:hypothetical protein